MRLRIAVVLLSTIAVVLGVAKALRVAGTHNVHMPPYDPFFIFLLPAIGLVALASVSFILSPRHLRIASVVLLCVMAMASVVIPVLAAPLAISLVGVVALNIVQSRDPDLAK